MQPPTDGGLLTLFPCPRVYTLLQGHLQGRLESGGLWVESEAGCPGHSPPSGARPGWSLPSDHCLCLCVLVFPDLAESSTDSAFSAAESQRYCMFQTSDGVALCRVPSLWLQPVLSLESWIVVTVSTSSVHSCFLMKVFVIFYNHLQQGFLSRTQGTMSSKMNGHGCKIKEVLGSKSPAVKCSNRVNFNDLCSPETLSFGSWEHISGCW